MQNIFSLRALLCFKIVQCRLTDENVVHGDESSQHKQLAAWRELRACANCFCWDHFFNDVIYGRSWKGTLRWRLLFPGRNFRTASLLFTVPVMWNYMIAKVAAWNFFSHFLFSTRGWWGRWKSHWPFHSFNIHAFAHSPPENNVEANAFWQNFSKPLSSTLASSAAT